MYVIRNLYNFYNLTSCENVPDTYFSTTSHYYTYLPNSPSRPSAHVWERLLVHCLTVQRGTYTSAEHLNVRQPNSSSYFLFNSSPYLPSYNFPHSLPLTSLPQQFLLPFPSNPFLATPLPSSSPLMYVIRTIALY